MAFPLDSTARSSAGVTVSVEDDLPPALAITATRTAWSGAMGNNLIGGQQRISAGVTISVMPDERPPTTSLSVSRRWGGIGTTVIGSTQGWTLIT